MTNSGNGEDSPNRATCAKDNGAPDGIKPSSLSIDAPRRERVLNAECQDCPARKTGCSDILYQWSHRRSLRRPELVALLCNMAAERAGDMACLGMILPPWDEITGRPTARQPPKGGKPKAAPARALSPVMLGRMPRR